MVFESLDPRLPVRSDKAQSRSSSASRLPGSRDLLAVGVIVAVYAVSILLMPPTRGFGYLDDWTYARTVEHIVAGQGFRPSEFAQATLVTHAYWGALFALLFGMSFTSLTLANLALSLAGAITFYLLLRQFGLSLPLSGLGVALLVLNPYYIILSYSYMTEITFVAFLLLTCLCYVRGMESTPTMTGDLWLWMGSVFATLAFLTRQFGMALPLAALLWLLLARRFRWRQALAVALLPCIAVGAYFLWSSRFGTTFSGSVGREELLELVRSPASWLRRAAHFVYLEAFLPGIMVPIMLRLRHRRVALLLMAATAGGVFALWQMKLDIVKQGQGTIGELSYDWLSAVLSNPALIYSVGSIFAVWLAMELTEASWRDGLTLLKGKRQPRTVELFYMTGLILLAGTFVASAGFLDRYWMPLWPVLIAGALLLICVRRPVWAMMLPAIMLFAAGSLYGVATHLDDYDNMSARWEAGQWLVAQGVPYEKIDNGPVWDGYYLWEEALSRLTSHDVTVLGREFLPYQIIDREYVIVDGPQQGYHTLRTYDYLSRRNGFVERHLFVLKRN